MQAKKDYASDNISSADYEKNKSFFNRYIFCLLYTSDAADE